MKYCRWCLQPDTRPGINFDEQGICPPCRYHENLKQVDWEDRRKEIDHIVEFGKQNSSSGYDCIIGVSGGKDSTRQALFVREVLKMKPLLVCLSYPPNQISHRGTLNISNLISLGFDCIVINPSPIVWQKLMLKGFNDFSNFLKSTELALFSSVPRLAIAYQIPLIWWGENAALQLGDLNVMGKNGSDGSNLRKMNTLGGADITWLLDDEIRKKDVLQYAYPSEVEMKNANLRITFLGYFWKDWSLYNNSIYAILRGIEIRTNRPEEIGDFLPSNALDEDWSNVNQMIKYYKFGFGRTTDFVNEEIRLGRMTRNEGIEIVNMYDGKCSDELIESLSNYLDISVKQFWENIDKVVNHILFEKIDNKWLPKFKVGRGI